MTGTPRDERDPLGLLPEFHRTTRMPLDAVVRLHFEGTVAYQNGFAANVSALGMFVKHPDPPEIGTRLVFEFVLGDERKPVQGGGVVAWVRERYEGPGRPAGVGIQFTELDALSRQHIAESLFEYLETELGVEVADHPDVPNLLAAMPRATTYEVGEEGAGEPAPPQGELSFAAESEAEARPFEAFSPRRQESPSEPSFRLFGDGSEPRDAADEALFAEAGPDLFAPVAPPEEFDPLPDEPYYGAAKRRETPRWLQVAIVVALVVGGLAAWWFVWGPGAERQSPPAVVQAAEAAPSPPERARLDPQPGPAATLAEAVGVESADAAASAVPGPIVEPAPDEAAAAPVAVTAPVPAAREAATAGGVAAAPPTSGLRFERLVDISWDSFDGGTDVALIGDGFFPPGSFRWFEMRDERPRVLVRLTGVASGFARTAIPAGTGELVALRSGFHVKPGGNELHIVLDLTGAGVRVEDVQAVSNRLVIRLRQP